MTKMDVDWDSDEGVEMRKTLGVYFEDEETTDE